MVVFGLIPNESETASANVQTVTDGSCSVEVNATSGVDVTQIGNECIIEFTDTGIDYEWTVPSNLAEAWVLVVGGGGGGGCLGGGGGGGVVEFGDSNRWAIPQTADGKLSVRVGEGGLGSDVASNLEDNTKTEDEMRGKSSFIGDDFNSYSNGLDAVSIPNDLSHIQAIGGGGGGCLSDSGKEPGYIGASAGGSGINGTTNVVAIPSANSIYETDGDDRTKGNLSDSSMADPGYGDEAAYGAGGGGAGDRGGEGSINGANEISGGDGGIGWSSSILGLANPVPFAGGGGGGSFYRSSSNNVTDANRGSGSVFGGNGGIRYVLLGNRSTTGGPGSGVDTRGGGGGGGYREQGADGGSGVVIVRYDIPPFAELNLTTPVASETGFSFEVQNYNNLLAAAGGGISWSYDSFSPGNITSADISESQGVFTVSGLSIDQSETFTVTASPASGGNATKNITGSSLKGQSALTFDPADMKFLDTQSLSATGGDGVGEISFSVDSGPCTITGNTVTATAVGACDVIATKAADGVFASIDSSTETITVSKATRRIEFTSAVPESPVPTGSAGTTTYEPAVSITNKNGESISGASATITINTTQTENVDGQEVCSISSGIVTFDEAGTCQIDAISNNTLDPDNYLASTIISQVIEIGQGNQNITFDAIDDKTFTSAPFKLKPTSSAGLLVELEESSSACSLSGSPSDYTVTIDAVGECSITATQDGNSSFAPASPITRTFAVGAEVPGPPILESVGFDDGAINISFKAPSFTGGASIDNYSLVATDDAGNSFANNNCGTTSPCTISGLTNGTQYTPTLTAINAAGESTAATAPAITPADAADSVTELVLVNGDQELTASWAKPTSFGGGTFTSYELTLSTGSVVVSTDSISDSVDTTTKTFTGLTNGNEYELEVVVISSANSTALQSNTATTKGIPATAPSPVRNITAEIESFDKAFISWVEPETNGGLSISSYQLSTGTDSTSTDTFRELTGLPGGDVEITIIAANDIGQSQPVSFVLELPNPPTSSSGSGVVFTGPIIESVTENPDSDLASASQQVLIINGLRLSGVTKAIIDGKEAEILSTSEDSFEIVIPDGVAPGTYDLEIESSIGNLTYLDAITIGSDETFQSVSYGEMSAWTKRISDSQAKVYVKFPTVGEKVRIGHQTGGSGSYETIYVKTTSSETMEGLRIVEGVGTYIVRTIDLVDINRIRVTVGDERPVQVRYNR